MSSSSEYLIPADAFGDAYALMLVTTVLYNFTGRVTDDIAEGYCSLSRHAVPAALRCAAQLTSEQVFELDPQPHRWARARNRVLVALDRDSAEDRAFPPDTIS